MLTYDIHARGNISKYEYLYRCIRADIEQGAIAADDRLPSKRALAQHLGVSQITVEQAYAQLVAEGYLYSRQRSGFYVCDVSAMLQAARWGKATIASSHVQEDQQLKAPSKRLNTASHTIADFTTSTHFDERSFAAWLKALRQVIASENPQESFAQVPAKGSLRLRQAIASHLRGSRGIEANPENIVVGAGSQLLYGLLVQLLGRNKIYGVEDPGYPTLVSIYEKQGASVAPIPLDAEGIDVSELDISGASVAHVMPSHQYPTGIVTSVARRYELLGWACRGEGRYIVEDDYDCELRLAGRPIPALASTDFDQRVIYLNTFNRSISPTLRVAYMVLPEHLSQQFDQELGFYANTVSTLGQVTLARMIENGGYERGINRLRTAHRAQRDILEAALNGVVKRSKMWLEQADSGLHCVLAVCTKRSERDIAAECREAGVLLAPLSDFSAHEGNYRAFADAAAAGQAARFLLNYAHISKDAIACALAIVAQAC